MLSYVDLQTLGPVYDRKRSPEIQRLQECQGVNSIQQYRFLSSFGSSIY